MEQDDELDGLALSEGDQIEDYEIVKILGAGGFGVTYLARDHRLHGEVALKEYLPAEYSTRLRDGRVAPRTRADAANFKWGLERVLEEARILRKLDHPNVVRVIRHFDELDTAFIVMEFLPGRTLDQAVREDGPWTEAKLRPVLDSLLDACEQVHAAGLLHRDIKPANIILKPNGQPVLIDFGAARQAISSRSKGVTALVSPGFGPVEQYSTKAAQGPYTDIYALAATCYFVLTGSEPDDAVDRNTKDDLPPLTRAAKDRGSPGFLSAIDAGLSVLPANRPQTIAAWISKFPKIEKKAEPAPGPDRRWLIGGGAATVVGLGAAALALWPRPRPSADISQAPPDAIGLSKVANQKTLPDAALEQDDDWTTGTFWGRTAFVGNDYLVATTRGVDTNTTAALQYFGDHGSSEWTGPDGSRSFALAADEQFLWIGGDQSGGASFVTALKREDLAASSGGSTMAVSPQASAAPGPGKVLAIAAAGGSVLAALAGAQSAVAILDHNSLADRGLYRPSGATVTSVIALPNGDGVVGGFTGQGDAQRVFAARFSPDGKERWVFADKGGQSGRASALVLDGDDVVLTGHRADNGFLMKLAADTGVPRTGATGQAVIDLGGGASLRDIALAARGFYYIVGGAWAVRTTDAGATAIAALIDSTGAIVSADRRGVARRHASYTSVAYQPGKALMVAGFTAPLDKSSATPTLTEFTTLLSRT